MIEIKGKVNTAICYAKSIEETAFIQIKRMCNYDLVKGSRIRIMPDVHAGKGCTIGTTMTVKDKVCPNIVGVDIGCGMYIVKLNEDNINFRFLDSICHFIPSGRNVWEYQIENFNLQELRCCDKLKRIEWLEKSLGTLGGGNHFIEVERSKDNSLYLVIHSGSRNLGKQVAEIYQNIAVDLHKGKEDYFKQRDEIIKTYKETGRDSEIQRALKELKDPYESRALNIPEDLCWLYGKYLDDYLHDIEICQKFARRNRELIAEIILGKLCLISVESSSFHTIHNYIDTDEMILRKGAIAAHKGEKVLIPINMRDGSILAIGRGIPDWNYSAPHGAGRIMSRRKAKESLNMEKYQEVMEGVYTTSVNENTLDESPMAYKSLTDIMDTINESVDVIDVLKPVYNFKASD